MLVEVKNIFIRQKIVLCLQNHRRITEMNDKIRLGKYENYKGKLYEVIGVAGHSETLEKMVVYRALYGEYGL